MGVRHTSGQDADEDDLGVFGGGGFVGHDRSVERNCSSTIQREPFRIPNPPVPAVPNARSEDSNKSNPPSINKIIKTIVITI